MAEEKQRREKEAIHSGHFPLHHPLPPHPYHLPDDEVMREPYYPNDIDYIIKLYGQKRGNNPEIRYGFF